MSTAHITQASLNHLLTLIQKRDGLQSQLAAVEAEIYSAVNGGSAVAVPTSGKRRGRKPGKAATAPVEAKAARSRVKKRGKRGALKDAILASLKTAGKKGMAVKDLSAQLGVKNQNVHVWFGTTGKTIKGLKKTGPGRYTLAG